MKTSWSDIQQIERYLMHQLDDDERHGFEAGMAGSALLRMNVRVQQQMMRLLHYYHRRKLKRAAERTRDRLFTDPAKASFRQEMTQLFKH
jgi:hypothetical protein